MDLKLKISDTDRVVLLQNLERMYELLQEGGESAQVLPDFERMIQAVEAKKDLDPTSVGLVLETLKQPVDPARAHQAETLRRIEADIKRDGQAMFKKYRMRY